MLKLCVCVCVHYKVLVAEVGWSVDPCWVVLDVRGSVDGTPG